MKWTSIGQKNSIQLTGSSWICLQDAAKHPGPSANSWVSKDNALEPAAVLHPLLLYAHPFLDSEYFIMILFLIICNCISLSGFLPFSVVIVFQLNLPPLETSEFGASMEELIDVGRNTLRVDSTFWYQLR